MEQRKRVRKQQFRLSYAKRLEFYSLQVYLAHVPIAVSVVEMGKSSRPIVEMSNEHRMKLDNLAAQFAVSKLV